MTKFISLVTLLLMTTLSAVAQTISIDTTFTNKGETVLVPIEVNTGNTTFRGSQIFLQYDSSLVSIQDVTIGSTIQSTSEIEWGNRDSGVAGLGLTTIGTRDAIQGNGTLFILEVLVKDFGSTDFTLAPGSSIGIAQTPTLVDGHVTTSIPVRIDGPDALDLESGAQMYHVEVGDLDGRNLFNYLINIEYDTTILSVSPDISIVNTLTEQLNGELQFNVIESNPGLITVGFASNTALSGDGRIFSFEVSPKMTDTRGGFTSLEFAVSTSFGGAAQDPGRNTYIAFDKNILVDELVFFEFQPVINDPTLNNQSIIDLVAVSDLTGRNIFDLNFRLPYDESIIRIDSVEYVGTTPGQAEVNMTTADDTVYVGWASNNAQSTTIPEGIFRFYVTNIGTGIQVFDTENFLIGTDRIRASVTPFEYSAGTNTAPTLPSIVSPADGSFVVVEGLPTDLFSPSWSASTDADNDPLTYAWQLSATADFATPLITTEFSSETSVDLPLSDVDDLISALAIGDTITVYHRAWVTDGVMAQALAGPSSVANLIRGVVNTPPTATDITVPVEGASITIQGDPTAPFVPQWTASTDEDGDDLTYTWEIAVDPDFNTVILPVSDLTDTELPLTVQQVADLLDANDIEVGVPTTFYHRANVSDGKVTVPGNGASVELTRGTLTNIDSELPVSFDLKQNYPNPFNPTTTISYSVAESRMVSLKIYDMIGREVATLVNEVKSAGNYTVNFNAAGLSTGVYIYRMASGDFVQTRKMSIMK